MLLRRALSLSLAILLVGLSAGVPASVAHAQPAEISTVDDLVTALQGRYKTISSLQASFVQVQSSAIAGEVRSKGTVQVKKARKARWETIGDQGSLFVTDGSKMSIYTPAMKQVIQMNDMSQASSGSVDILALLEDISKLDEQFEVSMVGTDDPASKKNIVVNAIPRKSGGYKSVRMEFDRKSLDLARVVFTDSMGGTTDLSFSGMKLDAKIDDSVFEFMPPDGVTVIDSGAM
jgi:outer membrane lipoprotein carrier protein